MTWSHFADLGVTTSPSPSPWPTEFRSDVGGEEGKVMPGLSGSCLFPGLGSLAQTQPLCAGLGLGHRSSEPHEPNRKSSDPRPREQTRGPGSLLATDSLGGLAATSFVYIVRLANWAFHKTHRRAEPALLESFISCSHRGRSPEPDGYQSQERTRQHTRTPEYHPEVSCS